MQSRMSEGLYKKFKAFEERKKNHKAEILKNILKTPPKNKEVNKEPLPKINMSVEKIPPSKAWKKI